MVLIVLYCDGIAFLGRIRWCNVLASSGVLVIYMQIRNSKLCEASKCRVYSAVNRPWWISKLFMATGFAVALLDRLYVTFGCSGGIYNDNGRTGVALSI